MSPPAALIVVRHLLADTALTLALCGCRAVAEVDRALVTPVTPTDGPGGPGGPGGPDGESPGPPVPAAAG